MKRIVQQSASHLPATDGVDKPRALKRTQRQFASRKHLVYYDPRQWDKDITTGNSTE